MGEISSSLIIIILFVLCFLMFAYLVWREKCFARERADLYNRIMVKDYSEYSKYEEKSKPKISTFYGKDRSGINGS